MNVFIIYSGQLLTRFLLRNVTNISSGCLKRRWWQEVVEPNNAEEKTEDGFNSE